MAPRNSPNSPRAEGDRLTATGQQEGLGLSRINPLVQCRTAHEFVCRVLREAILSGHLAGGTRLVQADIAAELDVSTTPVREALRDLATEGIIQLDAHRGAEVREIDISEVREVYELRRLLEPFAVGQAVKNITSAQLDQLTTLCEQMDNTDDAAEWIQLNREFHMTLIDEAQRPKLSSVLNNLTATAAAFVALAVRSDPRLQETGGREHAEILDAIERNDARKAEDITQQHLQSTLEVLEDLSDTYRRQGDT